jgi:hypothetical protein
MQPGLLQRLFPIKLLFKRRMALSIGSALVTAISVIMAFLLSKQHGLQDLLPHRDAAFEAGAFGRELLDVLFQLTHPVN